jgi:hypothetical protein
MKVTVRGRWARIVTLCAALLAAPAAPALAQLNGENLLGDMGVKSGTQPLPGFYVSVFYYRYDTDTIKDPSGNRITLDPTGNGSQTIQAGAAIFYYISKAKVLGGHFGAMAVVPIANGSLEAPGFGLSADRAAGLALHAWRRDRRRSLLRANRPLLDRRGGQRGQRDVEL